MPMFWSSQDGTPYGNDGLRYAETAWGKALVVRHATFWSALTKMGLDVAMMPRVRRPLEAYDSTAGWLRLGQHRGLTRELRFRGPVGVDDHRLMIELQKPTYRPPCEVPPPEPPPMSNR